MKYIKNQLSYSVLFYPIYNVYFINKHSGKSSFVYLIFDMLSRLHSINNENKKHI